jgi:NAD+ kinase
MQMKISKACVYVDAFNCPGDEVVRTLVSAAEACGISLSAAGPCRSALPGLASEQSCEAVIVLGGDGTILRGLDAFMGTATPVVGINTGHLGFLASAESSDLAEALGRLAAGDFVIEKLPALETTLPGGRLVHAVNDVCLNRALTVGMLHLELGTPGGVIARIAGDGVVVSTALGSTAYALSAGGPVLDPDLPAILVVPICAHQLSLRPLVFAASTCLRLSVAQARGDAPLVVVDGRPVAELGQGQSLSITSVQGDSSLIRFSSEGFYARLGRKLGWSARGQDAQ